MCKTLQGPQMLWPTQNQQVLCFPLCQWADSVASDLGAEHDGHGSKLFQAKADAYSSATDIWYDDI